MLFGHCVCRLPSQLKPLWCPATFMFCHWCSPRCCKQRPDLKNARNVEEQGHKWNLRVRSSRSNHCQSLKGGGTPQVASPLHGMERFFFVHPAGSSCMPEVVCQSPILESFVTSEIDRPSCEKPLFSNSLTISINVGRAVGKNDDQLERMRVR